MTRLTLFGACTMKWMLIAVCVAVMPSCKKSSSSTSSDGSSGATASDSLYDVQAMSIVSVGDGFDDEMQAQFSTPDLKLFELDGPVKVAEKELVDVEVLYDPNKLISGDRSRRVESVYFDEKGRLEGWVIKSDGIEFMHIVITYNPDGSFGKCYDALSDADVKLVRDYSGRITGMVMSVDQSDFYYSYKWTWSGEYPSRLDGEGWEWQIVESYQYNNGELTQSKETNYDVGESTISTIGYTITSKDNHGNWTERTSNYTTAHEVDTPSGISSIPSRQKVTERRKIYYYD